MTSLISRLWIGIALFLSLLSISTSWAVTAIDQVAVTSTNPADKQKYATLADFIAVQDTIRITADDGPGFGDQAASVNIVRWLRETQHYKGDIEFVYSYGELTKGKVISLFNLPADMSDDYMDAVNKIRFIKVNTFIELNKTKQLTHVALGINGGISEALCRQPDVWMSDASNYNPAIYTGLTSVECHNVANFYNTNVFVQIDPFPPEVDVPIGEVHLSNPKQGQLDWASIDIKNTYVPVAATPSLLDAKSLVENNSNLLKKLPALSGFVDGLINEDFNVLPIYGSSIQSHPASNVYSNTDYVGNMLQIIAAVRYAQLHGLGLDKPLIIAIFYNYDQEINVLNEIIHNGNWDVSNKLVDQLDYNWVGGAEYKAKKEASYAEDIIHIKETINQLRLAYVFSVASLDQPDTVKIFQQMKEKNPELAGRIILLSVGSSLPKNIFDALYANSGANVWPQIREGANSFNSLIATGKPHFRCPDDMHHRWEMGYDLVIDPVLTDLLGHFYQDVSAANGQDMQDVFCAGMETWQNKSTLYQTLGQLFIDSANPDSSISQYFQRLKIEAIKPENDRIARALEFGVNLLQEKTGSGTFTIKETR